MTGKAVFLLIGSVMLGTSALMFGGKQSSFESQSEQSEYQATVIARDIAESGYDEILSQVKLEKMSAVQTRSDISMLDGSYDQNVTANLYGDLDIQVDGGFAGVTQTITSNVIFAAPFPAAISLSDDEVDADAYGSSYAVSGLDGRAPSRSTGNGFLRPIAGIVTDDAHLPALLSEFNASRVVGANNEDGSAAEPSVQNGFDKAFYETIYNEAVLNVNNTIPAGTPTAVRESSFISAASSSSASNPKIIRVEGPLTVTSSVHGHGLLLVEDGDLNINSNDFRWEGLVLVRKQNVDTVRVNLGLNTEIHGAFVGYSVAGGSDPDDCAADFEIDDHTTTVVSDSFRVNVKVLGAAISMGGSYDMPVTLKVKVAGQIFEPFGDWDYAVTANVNTGNSGAIYEWAPTTIFPPNSNVNIYGRSWKKKKSSYSGNYNSHWTVHMQKATDTMDDQLYALADGDNVPNVGGYLGQYSVQDFVADYIDTGTNKMTMEESEAVYLYELGVNEPSSSAFDLQDLVVIVTFTRASATTGGGTEATACSGGGGGGTNRIEFTMSNNASVRYSAEAIAKLGQTLDTISDAIKVVVTSDESATSLQ